MHIEKNIRLTDRHRRPIATDIFYEPTAGPKPVIIYAHGFNGFKDWANFDLIAGQFAAAGFVFVKFNFSFNGTTPEHPDVFLDLEAYGNNNYTKELDNLGAVIDWVSAAEHPHAGQIDAGRIGLIGHSMGGGIVLLKAAEDARVKAVTGWASIAECTTPWGSWPAEKRAEWQQTGVQYVTNSRTSQELPLYYQLYEDYQQNRGRLDIEKAIGSLAIPVLLCHGTADPVVPLAAAQRLQGWQPAAELFTVDSDHVFGRSHPWEHPELPEPMQAVVRRTQDFFRE